jgi:FAD/FMN-containing dehydrogenase
MAYPPPALLDKLAQLLGSKGMTRDPADMAPWLADWRDRYHGGAAAMLSPATREEVRDVVALCAEAGVALVPQGGNTGMVGGATPDESGAALLLSMRRMNRIRSIDAAAGIAICEAGVILANLHEAALAVGRRFPLTLGAKGSATIGGLVSTNAGGTQVLRFGTMRSLVLGIEAVLPDGGLYDGLAVLKKDNRGYDLRQLLIGAEGTLGVVTAASLKLVPAVGERAVAWVGVESPQAAQALLRHLEAVMGDSVESFELVPAHVLALVLAHIPGTRAPLAAPAPWNVLVEAVSAMSAPGPEPALYEGLRSALETGLASDAVIAASEAQAEGFWRLRDSIAEAEKKDGPSAKHDISVPVEAMGDFLVEAGERIETRFPGTQVIGFGHLGDGNIHFNLVQPEDEPKDRFVARTSEMNRTVHDVVEGFGGSISAEHGIGQLRRSELRHRKPAAELSLMRRIKRLIDPEDLMNPGKLV